MLLRAGVGAVVPLAAARVRYGWVAAGVGALAAAAGAETGAIGPLLAGACGVAAVPVLVTTTNRALQAVAGALAVCGLLRLDDPRPLPAVAIGVVSLGLLTVPALPTLGRRARRRVLLTAAGVGAFAAVGVLLGVVAWLRARPDLEEAADLAAEGLELLGDDEAFARAFLATSAERFREAERALDAWWARPARVVPVVAQHLRAGADIAGVGDRLAGLAASVVSEVDLERLRVRFGTVDLAALRALAEPAATAVVEIETSHEELGEADSVWLTAGLRARLHTVRHQLGEVRAGARTVAAVTQVLPSMLGGDGTRRYLLLVQNPAEARGSGGLPGNFGEIVARDGTVELVRTGRLRELMDARPADAAVRVGADVHRLYVGEEPAPLWQNVTASPDFADAATIAGQLYAQSGGRRVDGVISVDPIALDLLLELTGPVVLPEGRARLVAGEAARLFLHEQYLTFPSSAEREERIDLLDDTIEAVWDDLTDGDVGSMREVAEVLAEAVAGRHIQIASFDPEEQEALERLGVAGTLPEPASDGVGFAVQNNSLNKIDWFVNRDARYEVTWDARTGAARGVYSIRIANQAPAEGLPDSVIGWGGTSDAPQRTAPGEYSALVHVYTVLEPTELLVDGQPRSLPHHRHRGWYVVPVEIRVPPGGRAAIDLRVEGDVGREWELAVVRQPSINGDDLSVLLEVVGRDDLRAAGADVHRLGPTTFSAAVTLDRPPDVRVTSNPEVNDGLQPPRSVAPSHSTSLWESSPPTDPPSAERSLRSGSLLP